MIFELAIDRYCSNAQPGATRRRMMSLQLSAEMVGGIASVASCHDLVGSRLSSGRAARRTLATLVVGTVTAVLAVPQQPRLLLLPAAPRRCERANLVGDPLRQAHRGRAQPRVG